MHRKPWWLVEHEEIRVFKQNIQRNILWIRKKRFGLRRQDPDMHTGFN